MIVMSRAQAAAERAEALPTSDVLCHSCHNTECQLNKVRLACKSFVAKATVVLALVLCDSILDPGMADYLSLPAALYSGTCILVTTRNV